jgi:hypothetical protein
LKWFKLGSIRDKVYKGKILMTNQEQILIGLTEIFNNWQVLLASLSEEQIATPLLPSSWTVKDIVAHMWGWQQASMARAEAAFHDREPKYPEWWEILGPDPEEDVDRTNAYLYDSNRNKPWSVVKADWKTQFMRYLELTKQVPEKDLLEPGRYAWMGIYALAASSEGSLGHHQEHYENLVAWLKEHGNPVPGERGEEPEP